MVVGGNPVLTPLLLDDTEMLGFHCALCLFRFSSYNYDSKHTYLIRKLFFVKVINHL